MNDIGVSLGELGDLIACDTVEEALARYMKVLEARNEKDGGNRRPIVVNSPKDSKIKSSGK